MGFGTPKYGNNTEAKYKKRNTWSLKESDSENIYRILPPMHSLAEDGKWAQYCVVHWGFSGVNSADASKTIMRPFNCVEISDRFRNVTQDCPQCVDYNSKKAEHDAAEANMKSAGKTKEEIEEALGSLKGYLKAFGPDKKFYLNVMNQAGEFGHLKIGYKAKKLLDAKIVELKDKKKIDPLALDMGVWFNFKRSGKGRETQDVVDVVTEEVTVEGETFDRIKKAPVSESVANKALLECEDLVNCGGFNLNVNQVELLVGCSGDPEEVDSIIGLTQKAQKTESEVKPEVKAEKRETVVKAEPKAETKVEVKSEEAKSEVQAEVKTSISNSDFLKKFGKKTKAA